MGVWTVEILYSVTSIQSEPQGGVGDNNNVQLPSKGGFVEVIISNSVKHDHHNSNLSNASVRFSGGDHLLSATRI